MRHIVFALVIGALAPLLASPAGAQTLANAGWPVCLTGGEEGSTRCEFASIPQCLAVMDGRRGTCILNPNYSVNAYAQMRSWY